MNRTARALTLGIALFAAAAPALAQQDWFRPPGSVGQGQQAPQRQQAPARQAPAQRGAPPPAPRAASPAPWNPLAPLFELFRVPQQTRPVWGPAPGGELAKPEVKPRRAPAEPAEPRGSVFETADAARKAAEQPRTDLVLVMGDDYAAPLAQGLADAFAADRPQAAVLARSRPGSGLLSDSAVDLVTQAPALASAEGATALVLFAGAADLRPIKTDGGTAEVLDDRWREIYTRRLDELLASLKAQARPAVLVGLPPAAEARTSERNQRYNELVKARVEQAGLLYADVWDGFVDENGKFLMWGPAVDGQRRRLRTADGLGFTRAGGRKLAFFVDRVLGKLLNGETGPAGAAAAGVPAAGGGPPSMIQLTGPGADGAAQTLAGAAGAMPRPTGGDAGEDVAVRLLVAGEPLPSVKGRTDDFRWQPDGADAVPTTVPAASAGAGAGTGTATPVSSEGTTP